MANFKTFFHKHSPHFIDSAISIAASNLQFIS